jgi:hypothetical protein
MRRQIAAVLCLAVLCLAILGLVGSSSLATAQQTAKPCLEQWQANAPENRANQGTEKAFVAVCRDGGAPSAKPARPPTLVAGSSNTARNRPVYSSIKELMESIIDPSADTLWGAVGTVVDKEGVHEALPKTQEEWLDVRRAAVRMIEAANLLMMPDREGAPAGTKSEVPGVELEPAQITALIKKKRKAFDAFAKELQAVGSDALRASDTKNPMLLMDTGAQMEIVCESCHQTFWYPGAARASTRN